MRDTKQADGRTHTQMDLVRQLQLNDDSKIVNVGLPISSVVDYDLKNYKMQLRKDWDLTKFLD